MHDQGIERIEKEFDIIKIVSSLRNMKVYLKNKFLSPKINFKVKHSSKNVIDIDHSDSESSSEQSNPSKTESMTEDEYDSSKEQQPNGEVLPTQS